MRPIYLCGFMGCGKSHIGRLLSQLCSAVYIDLDRYIVQQQGITIPEIFEKYGEPYFRDLEAEYVKGFKGRTVIACGGGTILRTETAEFAKNNGNVVFLDVPFDICYSRIKGDTNRPLVVNNSKKQLRALYDTRYPIYQSNCTFSVNGADDENFIAQEILRLSEQEDNLKKGK